MKSRISGWSFASLLMAVAIALNVLGAAFGKSVHEFLDDETNCLVVRIVIGAIGMSLVALAVRIRIKSGRGSTFLVSDRFAAIAFLGVAATIFVIGMSSCLYCVCEYPWEFMLGSWAFLFWCSVRTAVRAQKAWWVIPIALGFLAIAAVIATMCPA